MREQNVADIPDLRFSLPRVASRPVKIPAITLFLTPHRVAIFREVGKLPDRLSATSDHHLERVEPYLPSQLHPQTVFEAGYLLRC